MASKIDFTLATEAAENLRIACPKCTGKTAHKVLASLREHGSDDEEYQWIVDHQIVQCAGCDKVSFRQESSDSETYYIPDIGYTEKLYPPRLEGMKGLGYDRHHLPPLVRRIYDETLQAISIQLPVLAGIGLRALVETVCKDRSAEGSDLKKKITHLVEQKVLTPAGASILDKIRTLGNSAAHEVKPHSDQQLVLAMEIIEHLLQEVYILPKKAETEFSS